MNKEEMRLYKQIYNKKYRARRAAEGNPIYKRRPPTSHRLHVKGRESVAIAAERFRTLGFNVEVSKEHHGADMLCRIGGLEWSVEVKTASLTGNSWVTGRISKKRENDDLVAIVLPGGRVYIDSMKNHLDKSYACGNRIVSRIVKYFNIPKDLAFL